MLVWSLTAAIVLLVLLVVWLLRPNRVRGGQLDLTPAAARGELDLNWDDPRWDDEGITPIPTETLGLLGRKA